MEIKLKSKMKRKNKNELEKNPVENTSRKSLEDLGEKKGMLCY